MLIADPAFLSAARPYGGILSRLHPCATIVVAVSGGSDSTALLLLAHEAVAGTATTLVAATVDHGLRAESASEARAVAALCRRLAVRHRIALWEGEKPATGLAAAARMARYGLLSEIAAAEGASVVLTGHTADDQAETVLMRQARATDGPGAAGMAEATLFAGSTWIVRPLLGMSRACLRDFLIRRGETWAEDPTNADQRQERARIRAGRPDCRPLLLHAGAAARKRIALMAAAADALDAFAAVPTPGLFRLSWTILEEAGRDTAELVLRLLLATAGGGAHPPEPGAAARLIAHLEAHESRCTALARTVAERRGAFIYLWREARMLPSLPIGEEPLLWDRRWRISPIAGTRPAKGLHVAAAGPAASVSGGDDLPRRPARGAGFAEPMLLLDGQPLGPLRLAAREHGLHAVPVSPLHADFLPSFDLAAATAIARLTGAAEPPALPWARQNDEEA